MLTVIEIKGNLGKLICDTFNRSPIESAFLMPSFVTLIN